MNSLHLTQHKHLKSEDINDDFRTHIEDKLESGDWEHQPFVTLLFEWTDIFMTNLNLNIPLPIIGVGKLRKTRIAQYRESRNDLALNFEVIFNSIHTGRPIWKSLATLLHELCHCWQHMHGKSGKGNNHNKEFRSYAGSFGLVINTKGMMTVEEGRFTELLEANGVEYDLSDESTTDDVDEKRPKKVKWTCQCEMFSMRVEEGMTPNILCNDCGKKYQMVKK